MPTVVSRGEWGADESIRHAGGRELWPREFRPVRLLVIHHSNTRNDDPDPRASVRALYEYHCVAKGWGDIGYHYLVDERGAVYEGRFAGTDITRGNELDGREGVVGGHVYGYNYGSVGIALLGSLHAQLPTPEASDALVLLMAALACRYDLDPTGTVSRDVFEARGERVPVIVGHRHLIPTQDCPGQPFEAMLPDLRREVAGLIDARSFDAGARRAHSG